MQNWLSYHVFPLETPDVFLVRALRPFLATHIWNHPGRRAFFIRYEDESGPHIRIRLGAEPDLPGRGLHDEFADWMRERGRFDDIPYLRETDRFGGEEAMALAEEHFHLSTRVVLDRLNRPYSYGDAMFDTLRMHTVSAFAAGLGREQAAAYFDQLTKQWLPVFFNAEENGQNIEPEVLKAFEANLSKQRETLREALDILWQALQNEQFDQSQPEWARWYHGNRIIFEKLGSQLDPILPSLLHLSANRIGLVNQDEVFVNYILSRTLV